MSKKVYEYIRIFIRVILLIRIYLDIHLYQNFHECHTLDWTTITSIFHPPHPFSDTHTAILLTSEMQRFLETMARRPCACLLCYPYCWVQWALWRSNAHPGKSASWLFKKKLIWPVLSFEGPNLLFKLLFASLPLGNFRNQSHGLRPLGWGTPLTNDFRDWGFWSLLTKNLVVLAQFITCGFIPTDIKRIWLLIGCVDTDICLHGHHRQLVGLKLRRRRVCMNVNFICSQ